MAKLHVCRERFPWTQNLEALKKKNTLVSSCISNLRCNFFVLTFFFPCVTKSELASFPSFWIFRQPQDSTIFPQSNLRKKVQVVSCDGGKAIETLSFVLFMKPVFCRNFTSPSRGGSRIPRRRERQPSRGAPTYDFAKFSKKLPETGEILGHGGAGTIFRSATAQDNQQLYCSI